METGDIIFFKAINLRQKANVAGQKVMTKEVGAWSHVAVCISGPLIIHAMPDGGVKLEVLRKELEEDSRYIVARYSRASQSWFRPKLTDCCLYWLGEKYRILSIYHSYQRSKTVKVGESFCSYVIQKIFGMLQISPFDVDDKPMMPLELYDRLSRHDDWTICDNITLIPPEHHKDDCSLTLFAAYAERDLLICNAEMNLAAGSLSAAGQAVATLAELTAINPFETPSQKIGVLQQVIAPLKQSMGLETDPFLFYKNFLGLFLSPMAAPDFLPSGNRSWLFFGKDSKPFDASKAISDCLDFETSLTSSLADLMIQMSHGFSNIECIKGKLQFASQLPEIIGKCFVKMGARDIVASGPTFYEKIISDDLQSIIAVTIADWRAERDALKSILERKLLLLKLTDQLARLATQFDMPMRANG